MIKEAITILTKGKSLSRSQAKSAFEDIFKHKATTAQIAAFLVALKLKGESEAEIAAAASVVRNHAVKVAAKKPILDTCGTGGSGVNKFNISTAVSIICSAAGITVAKHGNRAMSSSCGSADVLAALGIKIDASSRSMEKSLKNVGIGFLYAPLYHPALKEVAAIRREMGIRTIFNILGPLCNPARATHQLLGVYSKDLVMLIAKVLRDLGLKKAFVVCSDDLKDEVSLSSKTTVAYLNNKRIQKLILKPSSFGLKKVSPRSLRVSGAKASAKLIKDILKSKKVPARNIVLANAACCLFITGKAKSLKDGVRKAAKIIDSGLAYKKLESFKKFLKSHA